MEVKPYSSDAKLRPNQEAIIAELKAQLSAVQIDRLKLPENAEELAHTIVSYSSLNLEQAKLLTDAVQARL